jgi:TonB family protein
VDKVQSSIRQAEGRHDRRATLADGVQDAAAARVLLTDDLPAEQRPRGSDRVLLVGLVWGKETLIELEQVGPGEDLRAGTLFDLPAVQLARNFRLVRASGDGGHVFTVPASLPGEVHRQGAARSLGELALIGKARRLEAPFKAHAYEIGPDDRVVARVAPQLTMIARYVRASPPRAKPLHDRIDPDFASTVVAGLLLLALFFLLVRVAPVPEPAFEDLTAARERIARYQAAKPPAPTAAETPKVKDLSGTPEGAKAKEEEGQAGKPEAKKKQAAPARKGTPSPDANKREADRRKVQKLGLLGALSNVSGPGVATSNVLGPGGLGSGINEALGGVKGRAGQGDAYGVGGLGTRGFGAGGGGTAIGIGGLGTKGSGSGRGGYGRIDLGGRGKEETQFVPGRTIVVGGLSRDVINRIIQRHYNEVKYCYEKELTRDPALYGKVAITFVIDGEGGVSDAFVKETSLANEPVESCIVAHVRRWAFPAPEGGSTVQVTYPYVFKSSGQ